MIFVAVFRLPGAGFAAVPCLPAFLPGVAGWASRWSRSVDVACAFKTSRPSLDVFLQPLAAVTPFCALLAPGVLSGLSPIGADMAPAAITALALPPASFRAPSCRIRLDWLIAPNEEFIAGLSRLSRPQLMRCCLPRLPDSGCDFARLTLDTWTFNPLLDFVTGFGAPAPGVSGVLSLGVSVCARFDLTSPGASAGRICGSRT